MVKDFFMQILKLSPTSSQVHVPSTEWKLKKQKTGDLNPDLNNTEVKVIEQAMGGTATTTEDWEHGLHDMQSLVEGVDHEMAQGKDHDSARETATENMDKDPEYYKKLQAKDDSTDDKIAKGLKLDLGSGAEREDGHIGFDIYPYDHGTIVHDLHQGIPVEDGSASHVRMVNSLHHMDELSKDPKPILSEIQRVLMPGGQFVYEGPNDIYNYPKWVEDYPGLVLVGQENNEQEIQKGTHPIHRMQFTRTATPDPATSNGAEPRIGVAQFDQLPADALLAMDAVGYFFSDATSSGRGNREHGYPSQGALVDKPQVKKGRRVATVAVRHGSKLLMGKRRDNGKWTVPGGHLNDGEDWNEGALRELKEETGIEVRNVHEFNHLSDVQKVADDLEVRPYKVDFHRKPPTSMKEDPDAEVHRWQWIDVSKGLPKHIADNMHVPLERNCLMKALGIGEQIKKGEPHVLMYLVRHGHTALNGDDKTDRIRGWQDIPLTDEGRKDAMRAANILAGRGARKVVSSDLSRAKETADIISDIDKLHVDYSGALRPWNLGNMQGMKTEDVLPQMKEFILNEGEPVPGGEPFSHYRVRFINALKGFLSEGGDPIIMVAHYRNLRTAQAWLDAGAPDDGTIETKTVLEKGGDEPGTVLCIMSDGTYKTLTDPSAPVGKSREFKIMKADKVKQIVYGVVLAPNEVDTQQDWMTPEDIEEAAHYYMLNARAVGSQHTKQIKARPVESYIAPVDFEMDGQYGKQFVKKGSWVVGIKVDDKKEWAKVEDGEYTGFSVGGDGRRIETT